jgi:hypothetical protein
MPITHNSTHQSTWTGVMANKITQLQTRDNGLDKKRQIFYPFKLIKNSNSLGNILVEFLYNLLTD